MNAARKRERREKTAGIRERVMERADGCCEACGMGAFNLALDHFLGGSGRRLVVESVEMCWALCRSCDRSKTDNSPSAKHWIQLFIEHCRRHGYAESEVIVGRRGNFR